jgi:hypothetical protein
MNSLRHSTAITVAALCAMFGFAVAIGLRAPLPVAWLVAIAVAGLTGWLVRSRLFALDPAAVSRPLAIVSAIAALAALAQLGRLTVFISDASRAEYSFFPGSDWEVHHNCATAYFVAAAAASRSPDIYADSLYTAKDDDPTKPRKALTLGPFNIDVFEYPPPFLLLPRALRLLAPEFMSFRALWFGLGGLFLVGVMLSILRLLTPAIATRALLWLPLVWLAPTTAGTIQKGNVQLEVVAAAVLAMAMFERRRWALGGLLLAFATVSKLYPGMLVVYLLARREWRAVAWTAALMLAFALVTGIDLGRAVYVEFARHMPGLLSGEAFPAFRNPSAAAGNLSIPGIVFKLKLFGVPGMGFEAMKRVGWLYTLVAIAATWWLAGRKTREEEQPSIWLAILIVATLRSPFLPQAYATFPAVWVLSLVAARFEATTRNVLLTVLAWLPLALVWPIDWALDPRLRAVGTGLVQVLMIGLAVWSLRRSLRSQPIAA